MGDILDASFKTLFNKIAAELFDKTHGRLWTDKFKNENSFI